MAELDEGRQEAQLEDGVDLVPGFLFDNLELVQVPGIDDEGLFADDISADAQSETAVGIVEVVGGADAEVVDAILFGTAPELFEVTVEALDLGEKAGVEGKAIQATDRIAGVDGGNQAIAGIADGDEMAGGDVAGGTDEGKVFHEDLRGWVNAQPECNQIGKKNKMQN